MSPKPISPQAIQDSAKKIRRMDSSRRIMVKSDTDSLPEADSIYNASPVDSTEELAESKASLPHGQISELQPFTLLNSPEPVSSPPNGDGSLPRSLSLPLSPRSPPLGHSQWPAPHLDTILEHYDSIRSLHHSVSAPRLRSSPQRSPRIVKLQDSFHSIRPLRQSQKPWPRPIAQPAKSLDHQRSFSLNDLDCLHNLLRVDVASECTQLSCTSSEALELACEGPSYPIKPVAERPERVPTPPGLPSFGTREAQVIRLIPSRERRRRPKIFPSWLVHSPNENDEQAVTCFQ